MFAYSRTAVIINQGGKDRGLISRLPKHVRERVHVRDPNPSVTDLAGYLQKGATMYGGCVIWCMLWYWLDAPLIVSEARDPGHALSVCVIKQAPSTTLGKVLGCSHHEGWGGGARVGMHPPAAAGGCKHVRSALGGAGDKAGASQLG